MNWDPMQNILAIRAAFILTCISNFYFNFRVEFHLPKDILRQDNDDNQWSCRVKGLCRNEYDGGPQTADHFPSNVCYRFLVSQWNLKDFFRGSSAPAKVLPCGLCLLGSSLCQWYTDTSNLPNAVRRNWKV